MTLAGLGWIAPIYKALAPMSPREVDEMEPWEVAIMLGLDEEPADHTPLVSTGAGKAAPMGMQMGSLGALQAAATAVKGA